MSSPLRSTIEHKKWTAGSYALDQEQTQHSSHTIHDEIMSSPPRPSQTPLHETHYQQQQEEQAPHTTQPPSRHVTPQQHLTTHIHTARTRRRTQFLDKLRATRVSRRDARLNDSFEHMDWLKEKRELEARYEQQAARLLTQIHDDPDVYEVDAAEQAQRLREEMQARYEAETQVLAEMYERELLGGDSIDESYANYNQQNNISREQQQQQQHEQQQRQRQQDSWTISIHPEIETEAEIETYSHQQHPPQTRSRRSSPSVSDEDLMDGIADDEFAGLLGHQPEQDGGGGVDISMS